VQRDPSVAYGLLEYSFSVFLLVVYFLGMVEEFRQGSPKSRTRLGIGIMLEECSI